MRNFQNKPTPTTTTTTTTPTKTTTTTTPTKTTTTTPTKTTTTTTPTKTTTTTTPTKTTTTTTPTKTTTNTTPNKLNISNKINTPPNLNSKPYLNKKKTYEIAETNLSNFGSEIGKNIKLASSKGEKEWEGVESAEGLKIWRIEKFKIVPSTTPKGSFYENDSYIVLNTQK